MPYDSIRAAVVLQARTALSIQASHLQWFTSNDAEQSDDVYV